MTLEEQVERFASKQWTATNTVGKNEIVVKFQHETGYHIYIAEPWWKPGQEIKFAQVIGTCLTLEEVKKHIAELPFASDIDANGWIVSTKEEQ